MKELVLQKPSRRRFQFGLRTLFLFVTAIAVWLGYELHLARVQRDAVRAIESSYGDVMYDFHSTPDGKFDMNARPGLPLFLTRGIGKDLFYTVSWVNLDSSYITDATMAKVGALSNLRVLHTDYPAITDAGMVHLAGLRRLRWMTVYAPNVGDAGIACLARITSLEELDLENANLTDTGLATLKTLTNLRRLFIATPRVTEAGVADLRRALPKCTIDFDPMVEYLRK